MSDPTIIVTLTDGNQVTQANTEDSGVMLMPDGSLSLITPEGRHVWNPTAWASVWVPDTEIPDSGLVIPDVIPPNLV